MKDRRVKQGHGKREEKSGHGQGHGQGHGKREEKSGHGQGQRGDAAGRGADPRAGHVGTPEGGTEIVYGLRAVLAVFARRPGDIVRVAYTASARTDASELLRWAQSQRVPHAELPDGELTRTVGASHHEGLCVFTRPRKWMSPGDLAEHLVRTSGTALAFDRVRNPYNIGAVIRSAAFFGVDAALLGAPAPHPGLDPAAVRVAEGGAEHLIVSRTTDLADTLGRLRARGVRVAGAESDGDREAIGFAFGRPAVLVLGHEREGLSDRVRAQCDALVAIRGSGAVESLNVAVAASVLIAEMMRRNR